MNFKYEICIHVFIIPLKLYYLSVIISAEKENAIRYNNRAESEAV